MATAPRRTTYTQTVIASNAAYGEGNKITLPFKASRVTVSVFASSGNPNLTLSFDGVTDVATLHNTGTASTYTFELQEVSTVYYKQSGTDCHFMLNAEIKAWPTTVG